MADARDVAVWTRHACEQWQDNREAHKHSDDSTLRQWLLNTVVGVEKVLDFGCGGGLWRELFREFDYTGADQNENMISYAHKRFPDQEDRFTVQEWNKLDFPDESFDLVFTSAVLQHNLHKDKIEVMKELTRVLRPGGYLMLTEDTLRPDNFNCAFPNLKEWHEDLDNGYSFTVKGWEDFIGRFGFKLVEYKHPSEYLYAKDV